MRLRYGIAGTLAAAAIVGALVLFAPTRRGGEVRLIDRVADAINETKTIEVVDYRTPPPDPADELADDRLEDKHPEFDPKRVDRRPEGDWEVNASAAVIGLDTPMLLPDRDAALLALRPSYAVAIAHAPGWLKVLPSINLVDGKAKQFDDGMLAALELARFRGWGGKRPGEPALIRRLYDRVGPGGVAAPYLAAGLKIAGTDVDASQPDQVNEWLERFEASPMDSKPFSFYTWSPDLERVFRFRRFFQVPLPATAPELARSMAGALGSDAALLKDYREAIRFQARLTNPPDTKTLADVVDTGGAIQPVGSISVLPASRSRETELFRRLFPRGLPPDADLMRALIRAIRSGEVDLAPTPESGWYEYEVHALETFLMPEKGREHERLSLTRAYKKRMLEAFKALMTKRRETFAGPLAEAKSAKDLEAPKLKPRLRVEPCPTYYLRMARSYDFVLNLLTATVGAEALASLHGLKEGGERTLPLLDELRRMRECFYGLHLLSAEDIGMAPDLHPEEPVDRPACEARANEWLSTYARDPDLAADTRISVPLYFDVQRGRTRLWTTVGVRLARLDANYLRGPRIRPAQQDRPWEDVPAGLLEGSEYLIAVDEFAEADLPGLQPLTRAEFRRVCGAHPTKEAIVEALSRGVR